jgi:hypothetical protein
MDAIFPPDDDAAPDGATDGDGDGFFPPSDCDDANSDIHPGSVDLPYNGIDEDCDGSDENDVDGDGYIATEVGGDDCADVNADIHPDAEEICGDGRDGDCDGDVDEGCAEVLDPTDPGGISWTCAATGATPGVAEGVLSLVVALVAARSRLRHLWRR